VNSAALVAPFATWMVLMTVLPSAPWSYAVRTVVVLGELVWFFRQELGAAFRALDTRSLAWGTAGGLVVLALWVLPEFSPWYRRWLMYGYTANAPVDQSAWYWKAIRLFGSAFVISVAEELFFRKWLIRWAGFLPMVILFALEHNRWFAGALAGALYGGLALRMGLASAIVAHTITNLALGLYVLATDSWSFW